jgi:transcriptional regulator with XRE-family HTH domain
MDSITKCLAHNLRSLRKKKNLTQSELAAKAGISLIFLQGIEAERKWVSPATTQVLAKALDVSESKLFENCFEPKAALKEVKRHQLQLEHVPDDVYYALATTCRKDAWKWEVFRWVLEGFERTQNSF